MATSKSGPQLHAEITGPENGPALVLLHTLGGTGSLWAPLIPLLPSTIRVIALDLQGHGRSPCPTPPYSMGALIKSVEATLDQLNVKDSVLLGQGLGGMIAQGVAVKRLDQARALILCNTAAKLGHAPHWQAMSDEVQADGPAGLAKRLMPLWFHRAALKSEMHLETQRQFIQTVPEGLAGCFSAIQNTDFYTPTSALRLSCLGISGAEDRFVPPDLMRETIDLIPGSEFKILRRAGHLPQIDQAEAFASCVSDFLERIGHV